MLLVGIDPDVKASGFAIWDTRAGKFLELAALDFFTICEKIKDAGANGAKIVIEAGWLNKRSNFHGGKSQIIGERIAKNVGENHKVGKLFVEFCEKNGLDYALYKPHLKKTDKVLFNKYFNLKIHNQDIIDAAMLVAGK